MSRLTVCSQVFDFSEIECFERKFRRLIGRSLTYMLTADIPVGLRLWSLLWVKGHSQMLHHVLFGQLCLVDCSVQLEESIYHHLRAVCIHFFH